MPRQSTPMTLTLDRIASPVGEVLVATDAEGAVRALDFHDYEDRMRRLLHRHYGPVELVEGRAPEAVRRAVEAYFGGDLTAFDAVVVKTGGTVFQQAVWAALRAIGPFRRARRAAMGSWRRRSGRPGRCGRWVWPTAPTRWG